MSGVHPDMTALRAVDACGGIYTPAEEASGFAAGHRAALASAMASVGSVDGLAAQMLDALEWLVETTDDDDSAHQGRALDYAKFVIAKATGSEASA